MSRRRLAVVLRHAVLIAFSEAIALPLLRVLRVSLTDRLTAYRIPPEIGSVTLENYVAVFTRFDFASSFGNSVFVALASTGISLPPCTRAERDLPNRLLKTGC